MRNFCSCVALLLLVVQKSSCWTSPKSVPSRCDRKSSSRRDFFKSAGVVSTVLLSGQPAFAAISQEQKDRENILKGYKRLQYLLDNWEKETTVCNIGQETTFGDKCERSPMKVMEYLGFRATNDPLFRADKTLMRLMADVPADKEIEYMQAMELFAEKAEEASSMAFVSSWGEANPGGGKDRVQLFIERSKTMVMQSRDSLGTVIDILEIKP
eukprot:CAMPEP_0117049158 /NCGR_PEP_ID=MMETSP0472-20121206/33970_1 /TAXON_ID=693140 ORGANISM="Tiarina fusus, Strain LIS" /NCGR_SAMPLE_ID=MMETSP0472 /ASSEMBLY_ACC=CAM_ASM_000603 /LENGTH=211 /DNA_ID=CAMNT_0004762511 /DNA_START=66 /DNA_END=701 /DNA_ORIENTATION=-